MTMKGQRMLRRQSIGTVWKWDNRVVKATCCSKPHVQGWFLQVRVVRGATVLEKPGMNLR